MKNRKPARRYRLGLSSLLATLAAALAAPAAHASGAGTALPWDTGIEALVSNIQGPVAHSVVIGGLCVAGLIWAVTDHGTGVKWLIKLIMGGALAIGVVDAANTFGIFGAIA